MLWTLSLVVSLAIILFAAELFTNGVEWVGNRLGLGEGVVGSILAAVGTAMPETLIPIVAILFFGPKAAEEVGIGAIMGAPFMLSTLAMFVTGMAVIIFARRGRRSTQMKTDPVVLGRDLSFFLAAYTVAFLAGLVPASWSWLKPVLAVGLVLTYAVYVYRHLAAESEMGADPNPLHLAHWVLRLHSRVSPRPIESITPLYFLEASQPKLSISLLQTVAGILLMLGGAHIFVQSVDHLSVSLGIPALILALIIAPIATELPEKFNSVLWVRVGKDTLAMGNITGAMVFQGSVLPALGIAFTAWTITADSAPAFVSAAIAVISTLGFYAMLRIRGHLSGYWLLGGGVFYVLYLAYILVVVL